MILRHFHLNEQPFGVTPDPRYLYGSETHREALASLLYGIRSGLGFMVLTAQPGMGKTTLLFEVLRQLGPEKKTVFLFQTLTTKEELIQALLRDLGFQNIEESLVGMQAQLNHFLANYCVQGRQLVLIIDEAQNLSDAVLEAVRMLSNFETASAKLMQIILAGQLQLAEKLDSPELLQLRQRVSIFGHLQAFDEAEVRRYVDHRLRISGYWPEEALFTPAAIKAITRYSDGIPRNINNICFNALSLACAMQQSRIDGDVIETVAVDLRLKHHPVLAPRQGSRMPDELPDRSKGSAFVPPPSAKSPIPFVVAGGIVFVILLGWILEHENRNRMMNASVLARSVEASLAKETTAAKDATLAKVSPLVKEAPIMKEAPDAKEPTSKDVPPSAASAPLPVAPRVIEVQKGDSLISICAAQFGTCGPDILERIVQMNPSISDPDELLAGQKILLPVLDKNSKDGVTAPLHGTSIIARGDAP